MNLILQKQITGVITQSNAVKLGQNKYFNLAQPSFPLSLGLEARRGYFMSVRPMYKQLMVNVNVCMAAFYTPGNMADAMFEYERQTGGMPSQFVQRLKVVTSHLGYPRKRAILRIMGTNPRQQSFPCAELGGTVTVEQYFQRSESASLHEFVISLMDNSRVQHPLAVRRQATCHRRRHEGQAQLPSTRNLQYLSRSAVPW